MKKTQVALADQRGRMHLDLTGEQRLRFIQGLRANLANMINPHQASAVLALRIAQRHFRQILSGVCAVCGSYTAYRPQTAIKGANKFVNHGFNLINRHRF